MRVEHSLHPVLYQTDDTVETVNRKGIVSTNVLSGETQVRDFSEKTRYSYRVNLEDLSETTDKLALFESFLEDIQIAVTPFWLPMPISRKHGIEHFCGPEGDGVLTAFPFPFREATEYIVKAANVIQIEGTDFDMHESANVVSDQQASPYTDSLIELETGPALNPPTLTRQPFLALEGLFSYKVAPIVGGAAAYLETEDSCWPEVEVDTKYRTVWHVWGAYNYEIRVQYKDSGGSSTGSATTSGTIAGSNDEWTAIFVDSTSESDATHVDIRVTKTTLGDEPFWADCLAHIPGQIDRWHLPSNAPGVLEFDSAVADGVRVKAMSDGYQLVRGVMTKKHSAWKLRVDGIAYVDGFEMVEAVE